MLYITVIISNKIKRRFAPAGSLGMDRVAKLVDQSVQGERTSGNRMRPRRGRTRRVPLPVDPFAFVHARAEKRIRDDL